MIFFFSEAKKQKRLANAKAKQKASTKGKGKGRAKGGSKGRGVKRRLDLDDAVESECEENPGSAGHSTHVAEAEDSTVPADAPQHVAEGEVSTVPADADAPVLAEEQVAVAEEQAAKVDEPTLPMESEHKDELIQEKSEIEIEESGAAASGSGVGAEVVPPVDPLESGGVQMTVEMKLQSVWLALESSQPQTSLNGLNLVESSRCASTIMPIDSNWRQR